MTKALQSTAYHEAGHAVMCWHEGIGIRAISIVRGGGKRGTIKIDTPRKPIQRDIEKIASLVGGRTPSGLAIFLR